MNPPDTQITVLGGGASGVCVGYYARKHGLSAHVHEAAETIGGNAATLCHGAFLFDTGAHRVHDGNPDLTRGLKILMGEDLQQVRVPSHIFFRMKTIDFPLSPVNLLRPLGPFAVRRAVMEVVSGRLLGWRKKPISKILPPGPMAAPSQTPFCSITRKSCGAARAGNFLPGSPGSA